jgi:hypothetical protein
LDSISVLGGALCREGLGAVVIGAGVEKRGLLLLWLWRDGEGDIGVSTSRAGVVWTVHGGGFSPGSSSGRKGELAARSAIVRGVERKGD